MTTNEMPTSRFQWLASDLTLGFLVVIMTIFTAVANYATYVAGGKASGLQIEGDRLLAESNTEYISASQFIIVDYTMYDNYYINLDVDDFAAEYYQSLFSESLQGSVDRREPFDDQYYDEMYATADEQFASAFEKLDAANAEGEREAGFQLVMLLTAVGLGFAAYASLLSETNRLRYLFSSISLLTMILGVIQFTIIATG